MNSTTWLASALAALFTASSGTVVSNDARRVPAFAATDAATGAAMRVYRGNGVISLEVDHPTVQIRKELTNGKTTTSLRAAGEEIVITLSHDGIVVRGGGEVVQAGPAHPGHAADVKATLSASRVAARAAALIGRMELAPSPLQHTLLSTRALLLSATGDDSGAREMSRAVAGLERARSSSLVRTSANEEEGPGECWTLYAIEAIAAYVEYEECMRDEQWWDIFGQFSCGIIYDIRAVGAFAWWLSCVGLRG